MDSIGHELLCGRVAEWFPLLPRPRPPCRALACHNLGRLATRGGDGARAYRIFENAYDAVRTQAVTEIDGRDVDFWHFVNQTQERQELQKFLWTILLADGTRALITAGRWNALTDIVELAGLRRGTMSVDLLDDLLTSAKTSEAQLAQVLAQ